MVERNLSDQEMLEALSFEYNLNKKRTQNDKFEVKYNFGKCRVCKSEATGIHYGVSSCEGCKVARGHRAFFVLIVIYFKGFFKRSLTRHKNYACKSNKNCVIYPKQRKKCKFCRWMACLDSGMSLSEVRVGRIPNYMKEIRPKSLAEPSKKNKFCLSLKHYAKLHQFDQQILPKINLMEKYLNCSFESQLIVLALLRDKSYQIFKEQTKEFEEHEKLALKVMESNNHHRQLERTQSTIQTLKRKNINALLKHASSMFQIINQLPGFQRISKKDLPRILSDSFFMIFGVRAIKLYINDDYFFMLDENTPMNREVFALLTSESVRDCAFEFYSNLKSLNLTDQEYSLLIPIFLLMFTSNDRLENPQVLKELSEYYSRALLYEFSLNNRTDEFLENFRKAISCAPKVNKMCQELDYGKELLC